uniref:BESS domain-containing protein n=1 Tax=Angiostrongylus cantonensis TaxID=6313 RepID=A0A0K0CVE7_ANGCA
MTGAGMSDDEDVENDPQAPDALTDSEEEQAKTVSCLLFTVFDGPERQNRLSRFLQALEGDQEKHDLSSGDDF